MKLKVKQELFDFIIDRASSAETQRLEKYISACQDATEDFNKIKNGHVFSALSCYSFADVAQDYFNYRRQVKNNE